MNRRILTILAGVCLLTPQALAQTANDGISQFHSGRLGEAERTLGAVSEKEPKDARSQFYLVLVLSHEDKLEEAETIAKKLAESAPDSEYSHLGAARVYIQRKDYDRAEVAIKAAQKSSAEPPDLLFVRGLLRAAKKEYRAAADDLEKVIEMQPRNAYAHYYAGLAYNGLKRPDKMVEHLQHFLRLAPDAPEARKVQSILRAIG